jgi:hypothetical protein
MKVSLKVRRETDEEKGDLAASLEDHFKLIDSMGLLRPPLPRPLQESKRAWLRRVRCKHKKKKSWKVRNQLACKSRAAPSHKGQWESFNMPQSK